MKPTRWLISAALCACSAVSADTVLRVDGAEPGMHGLPMTLDGQFVGVVGDTVTLTPFSHQLSIELPSGLSASYEILATQSRIYAAAVTESKCLGATYWSVGSSSAASVQRDADRSSVRLPAPSVRLEGVCPIELPNLACLWREADLQIHSIPEVGAEVWIDGIRLGGATSEMVNLGYCGGTAPHVEFLLRKPGYATCSVSVRIEDERGPYDVGCVLRKL